VALPRVHRLKNRQDFNAIYQSGLRRSSPHLTLRALRQPTVPKLAQPRTTSDVNEQPTQIGITISQKVSKRAVVRNRIKRQIRAALQQLLPQILPGWQIVVVVRPEAIGCDYEKFLQELKQLLVSAEVMHGH
jgi:ribonuclease P protein component